MKTAVIYRSFFWTTKRYAQWLKEALDGDILVFKGMSRQKLAEYDLIIVCSAAFAGWMPLIGFLKKWWEVLKDKKVIALAISILPVDDIHLGKFIEKMPEQIERKVKIFKISDEITLSQEEKRERFGQIVRHIKEERGWQTNY